jgi:hypothetical protein
MSSTPTRSSGAAPLLAAAILAASGLSAGAAHASDPAAAREQLKQGWALKEAGRCSEAIPHFVESQRLDPKPKALLNLADCEDRLGDLVSAQQHSVQARDLARQDADPLLLAVAEQHLAALDKRLPRLTIVLAHDTPPDTAVSRDGTALGSVSLGVALPANPGKHVVVASVAGHADRTFEVELAEGAQQSIEVAPGDALAPPAPQVVAAPAVLTPPPSSWTARKSVALSLVVVGTAGMAVGAVFGVLAIGKNNDSNANNHCNASGCDPTGTQLRNDALTDATVSTVAFGAGVAVAAAGVVLWWTAPAQQVTSAGRLEVAPSLGPHQAGLSLAGVW